MKHITELELIEYVNGSVTQPQKAVIERHMAQCESCRQLCKQTKLVYDSLGDLTAPQVNDLTAKVRQAVTVRTFFGWKHLAYNLARAAAVIMLSALAGYSAAVKFAPQQQTNSVSALKTQSEISFAQPARHIALAVSGEIK